MLEKNVYTYFGGGTGGGERRCERIAEHKHPHVYVRVCLYVKAHGKFASFHALKDHFGPFMFF